MSILPSHAQGSDLHSSSADQSRNPSSSEHGSFPSNSPPPSSSPLHISFGSLGVSDPSYSPVQSPDSMAPIAEETLGSSEEVIRSRTRRGKETLSHQNVERQRRSRSGGQWAATTRGDISGVAGSPGGKQNAGAHNSSGSATNHYSTGRRANAVSGNHLLNFHYDPVSRSQPRAPPPPARKQQKRRPYNKDLFLQANYKFVVLDTGEYSPESMDPDKMLQWEDIICVRHSTPFPVVCPICLEYPLCPQITSCGHIFCFPCILQYLLMGVENHWTESFKRCPLCFVMVSPKDLYTIHIENVKQYSVGETIEFMLLTRQKSSFTPSRKNKGESGRITDLSDEIYDPFSKFTFTADVDLSVRQAMSDLDGWLARADSGLVDDIEKLPYVTAAIGQLKQRKKYWNEHKSSNNCRSVKRSDYPKQSLSSTNDSRADLHAPASVLGTLSSEETKVENPLTGDSCLDKSDGETSLVKSGDDDQSIEGQESTLSSSYEEKKEFLSPPPKVSVETKEIDSYNFYQAADGQHIILHSLNMRCLLHHYGSYDRLPPRVGGKILEMETLTQSEATRKRYRYLSHFSLTTTYQLCEIDLSESLPPDALAPFMDEIKKRERQRKQRANKERKEQIKAEVAAAAELVPLMSAFGQSSHNNSPSFSLDDFAALGNSAPIASSPPNLGERNSFSNVTRLGFAAGHDSPGLKNEDNIRDNNEIINGSSGSRNQGVTSFANVISRTPPTQNMGVTGKRGKKTTRVLLSTGGGRRY